MDQPELNTGYRIAVPPAFGEVFTHFYVAANSSAAVIKRTLLPSFQTILVFSFGAPVTMITRHNNTMEIDKCIVIGPIKQAFDYSLSPGAEILVANFKEDAFFRFFGEAAIAEKFPVHPDDLLQENCFTALWQALSKINDMKDRVNYILDFCQPYLQDRDPVARQLVDFKGGNMSAIKAIAEKNALSERAVQLTHKKHLGFSAKELNRYQRFLKAVQWIQAVAAKDRTIDWFEIISECGYYDQSQLIHDFTHFLNLSPTKYLRFQQDICYARS
ncbi:helix-turn-helix domain-containing protein [Longitalea arenae]|uniref:helix-turn-helix domain-containing protein n=1 Tax=Longitalea arenae TaxID=2812558 RepID=UPI001967E03A|nr:helix-turn-helix domain-containing protein [Longitalea arenae]